MIYLIGRKGKLKERLVNTRKSVENRRISLSYAGLLLFNLMAAKSTFVALKQGTLRGVESSLPNGAPYYSFKGVPYATPPLGNLRFRPPVPLEKFVKDPLDCIEEGGVSFQRNPFSGEMEGGEDCLYLNIYTPNFKPKKPMPVMIWVHGGGFAYGNGHSDYYLPLYLMMEDVVVLTFTYRLGIFGFLYLPEAGAPGNVGLRDQVAAFQWVKDNIHNFGGDPENLTMFGQSAGAAAIHIHALSPTSKKYINKAIMQGGNSLMEWVLQKNPLYKARKLAELMGCTSKNDKEIGEFLRKEEHPANLYVHWFNILTPDELRRGIHTTFRPIVEGDVPGAIIPRNPLELAMDPNSIQIPIMMGYCNKEGIAFLKADEPNIEDIDDDLARMIPRSVNLEPDDPKCLEVAEQMRQFYLKGGRLTLERREELINILGDYHFIVWKHLAAEISSRRQHKSPFYLYRFSFDGELNYFKKNYKMIEGACHGDDRFYLFQRSVNDGRLKPGTREELTVKRMCRMWTNFAKYGDPTPVEDDIIKWKWNPVKKINNKDEFVLDYLEINDNVRMDKNPDVDRVDFWRHIYRTWNQSFLKPKL